MVMVRVSPNRQGTGTKYKRFLCIYLKIESRWSFIAKRKQKVRIQRQFCLILLSPSEIDIFDNRFTKLFYY